MSYGGSAAFSEAGEGPATTGRAWVPRSERGRFRPSHTFNHILKTMKFSQKSFLKMTFFFNVSASGKGEAEQFPVSGTVLSAAKNHLAAGQFIPRRKSCYDSLP